MTKKSYPDCVICGEKTSEDDIAEMYDEIALGMNPQIDDEQATRMKLCGFVHPECGLSLGWAVA